jgi:hypothetical protein
MAPEIVVGWIASVVGARPGVVNELLPLTCGSVKVLTTLMCRIAKALMVSWRMTAQNVSLMLPHQDLHRQSPPLILNLISLQNDVGIYDQWKGSHSTCME